MELEIAPQSRLRTGPAAELLPLLIGGRRVVAVVDANVARLHPALCAGLPAVTVEAEEGAKRFQTVERICREFVALGADRTTFVVGIGGGIVTDMAGFAASVYMRGVPFGFVPTTLLAQVDAAIGGKNGVNLDGFKNMIGTFSQPEFVLCDPALLRTLPEREFRSGIAEAVKAAVIADGALFELLEQHDLQSLRNDGALLQRVIEAAVRVKAAIVAADEREAGQRRKLNLGHTLGHAIERATEGAVNHGEAVAAGMVWVARQAVREGLLAAEEGRRIEALLVRYGFDLTLPADRKALIEAMAKDKKSDGDALHAVLPTGIGRCEVRRMPFADVAAWL